MTQMLELSDKDFETAIIKMLHRTIINTHETNKKPMPQQRNRLYKEKPSGNFRTEKYSNREGDGQDREKSEFEERTIKISQSQYRENRFGEQMNKNLGTSGTKSKVLAFISLGSQAKRRKGGTEKYLKK